VIRAYIGEVRKTEKDMPRRGADIVLYVSHQDVQRRS
jgi:hypothetical protein